MEINESTRVMGAASGPPASPSIDRTMVAGAPAFAAPGATQMGVTVTCPICRTNNSGLEAYCGECGFLLSSAPGREEAAPAEPSGPAMELVENTSGRRFRLKSGANYVGRENCDILLMEPTVSRRHAQVTLDNGTVTVTDLGSTNGSEVDGAKLTPNQPVTLREGAGVRFGNSALTFSSGAAAPPQAPAEVTVQVGAVPVAPGITDSADLEEAPVFADLAGLAEPAESTEWVAETDEEPVLGTESEMPEVAAAAPAALAVGAPETVAVLRPTSGSGAEIPVRQGAYTIGRREGNDVVISGDPYVSGSHAMLQSDPTGCYITDVGSTNGTTVNGAKLEPNVRQLLLDGDELGLGQTTYRFETVAQAQEPAEAAANETEVSSEDPAADEENGPAPDEVMS